MRRVGFLLLILTFSLGGHAQNAGDDQAVRNLVERWNTAYVALDAKTLANLHTPEFDILNRLGQWTHKSSNPAQEALWAWTFRVIYNGSLGQATQSRRCGFSLQTLRVC